MIAPTRQQSYQIKTIHHGLCEGAALVSRRPLSFWGGVDPRSGRIIDVHHDLAGISLKGKIFVFPQGAGSSSGCGVLMELIRLRTNPIAIINISTEAVLALGPIIAEELYQRSFPIVNVEPEVFQQINSGDHLRIDSRAGTLIVQAQNGDN